MRGAINKNPAFGGVEFPVYYFFFDLGFASATRLFGSRGE